MVLGLSQSDKPRGAFWGVGAWGLLCSPPPSPRHCLEGHGLEQPSAETACSHTVPPRHVAQVSVVRPDPEWAAVFVESFEGPMAPLKREEHESPTWPKNLWISLSSCWSVN